MKKAKKTPKPQLDMFGGFEEKVSFETYNAGQKPKGLPSAKLLENYIGVCNHKNLAFIKTKFFKETEMPIIQKIYGSPEAFISKRKSGIGSFRILPMTERKCRPVEWRTILGKFFFGRKKYNELDRIGLISL